MSKIFPSLSEYEEEALREEARRLSVKDLHYLAKELLGYNRLTDHIHKEMARDIDTPKYRFKLLLWPRGHFKSTLGTESYPVKKLLRDPNERILLTNAKLENSRKFLRSIASHFTLNPKFRWVWRDWWIEQYASPYHRAIMKDKLDWVVRDVQDEFTVLRPGTIREASITTGAVDASLVSQHYSTIIADDLINREYVRTVEMVEKSILYFKDLLDLLDPDGELMLIGTRWAYMDLYGWIMSEFGGSASLRVPENYQGISEQARRQSEATPEEEKQWMISVRPTSIDNPIFPEEFTSEVLSDLARTKGPYEYGAQYELDPVPAAFQKFKDDWVVTADILPDPETLTVCITVDPAKSLGDSADHSAIAVCGYDERNVMYLLDGRDEKMTEDELLETLFSTVVEWSKKARFLLPVGFEAIGFQELYVYNLERMMLERDFFFAVEPIKRRQMSKDERILRLVPRIKNGFVVPKKIIKQPVGGRDPEYDLVQRLRWYLSKFPLADRKDLLDTMADQLDIVKATSLPKDVVIAKAEEREFTHPSVIEDRSRRKGFAQAQSRIYARHRIGAVR